MDMIIDALLEGVAWLMAKGTVDFAVWKPRLAWLLLALLPGGIAAAAVYAATGTLTVTTLAPIALAAAPAALALRWAARRLW
ncbi:hypothetical protein FBZ83_11264 [Azospirillum brasilense]|uniref:Uncharacterized protein n=1 Tax=Azospirillum brasilense TaxID=192 RepID=A0A560C133_AZOBR|nr:hypothetical protein [Azospirillum brasilense]TWA78565.1 hypothetical protein FBZ83_11264 [Azospirillum brasilense]